MKKLFIVVGSGVETKPLPLPRLEYVGFVIFVCELDPLGALNEVNKAISQYGSADQENNLVVYMGDNLSLLKKNIPCAYLDIGILYEKLFKVVGAGDCKNVSEIKIVNDMLVGALSGLVRKDDCSNLWPVLRELAKSRQG